MLGGVMVNFLLAIFIYVSVLYVWGEQYLPTENVKYGILVDSVGMELGLRNGDKIISVDHQKIDNFYQIIPDIVLNDRKTIQIERDGKFLEVEIPEEVIPDFIKGKGSIEPRMPFSPLFVTDFMKNSPAKEAGLKIGDEIFGFDSIRFEYHDEYRKKLAKLSDKEVTVNIKRGDELLDFPLRVTTEGLIGVIRDLNGIFELKQINYGLLESIPAGIKKGVKTLKDYLKQLKLIFSPKTKAYESLGGFITIVRFFPGEWDWHAFWNFTAFLSIILAIINILPIPALDGGHVMFLLYEVVSGRKPSDKFLEYAQITGMILLLALLIFANGNDIIRLLKK
jgi:regulator of sigma E protease